MANFSRFTLEDSHMESRDVTIDLQEVMSDAIEDGNDIETVLGDVDEGYVMEFVVDFVESHRHGQAIYDMFSKRVDEHVLVDIANQLLVTAGPSSANATSTGSINAAALCLEELTEGLSKLRNSQDASHAERLVAHDRIKALQAAVRVLETFTQAL